MLGNDAQTSATSSNNCIQEIAFLLSWHPVVWISSYMFGWYLKILPLHIQLRWQANQEEVMNHPRTLPFSSAVPACQEDIHSQTHLPWQDPCSQWFLMIWSSSFCWPPLSCGHSFLQQWDQPNWQSSVTASMQCPYTNRLATMKVGHHIV